MKKSKMVGEIIGEEVLILTNAYSLRLKVEIESEEELLINFKGWFVDGMKLNATALGNTVKASIIPSGGDKRSKS